MHIKKIAEQALERLKQYDNFPESGIIAGGSISNIMWEIVSGNKAVINDIDVFIFDSEINTKPDGNYIDNNNKLSYVKSEVTYDEDYSGLKSTSNPKEYYLINNSEHIGIWNFIHYSSNIKDISVIINSFDINCTQIGYSIDKNEFYWTKEFEEFLKTGNLKLTNLLSPYHSIIRMCKKEEELKANLDDFEFDLVSYISANSYNYFNKKYFSTRYLNLAIKYKSKLFKHFSIYRDNQAEENLKSIKGVQIELYKFEPINNRYKNIFNGSQNSHINSFLFYARNILNDNNRKKYWEKLHYLYNDIDYIDIIPSDDDLNMLHNLIVNAPKSINILKGLKLSTQLSIIKKVFSLYPNEPNISIAILEKIKINPDGQFDDSDILILELSVRKELLLITKEKIEKVMGKFKEEQISLNMPDFGF